MIEQYENKAMKTKQTKELRLNANLRGKRKDDIVTVQVDAEGIPLDPYWRRRIEDASIDNCVEFVKKPKKASIAGDK